MSQDREEKLAAHTALAQMLGEMREDRYDISEIRAEQFERNRQYRALIQWLASPEPMPSELVGKTLDAIFYSNRTLYPRRSAWATMIAAGQLARIEAPALVTRLGNFYENIQVRVSLGVRPQQKQRRIRLSAMYPKAGVRPDYIRLVATDSK